MNTKETIQSLSEDAAKLFRMVIRGSDTVGCKKIWQRDIEPSRHALTTQEAIDTLTDLALVTKEQGFEEGEDRLYITVKAAETVGLRWNRHNEWGMPEAWNRFLPKWLP